VVENLFLQVWPIAIFVVENLFLQVWPIATTKQLDKLLVLVKRELLRSNIRISRLDSLKKDIISGIDTVDKIYKFKFMFKA